MRPAGEVLDQFPVRIRHRMQRLEIIRQLDHLVVTISSGCLKTGKIN
jgi:hypothetical protein